MSDQERQCPGHALQAPIRSIPPDGRYQCRGQMAGTTVTRGTVHAKIDKIRSQGSSDAGTTNIEGPMRFRQRFAKARVWARLPRRTVRLRLTLLYGILFLASGGVLLILTDVLWNRTTTDEVSFPPGVTSNIKSILTPKGTSSALVRIGQAHTYFGPGFVTQSQRRVNVQLLSIASHQHNSDLHLLILFSALGIAVMAVLAIGLGWLMAGRTLRPLRMITSAAREISATNLHERLRLRGPSDELKELGDTFDDLIERLEGSFQSQRQFAANASHELRTPLATMRASLDVAMAKPGPVPEQIRTLADRLHEEFDHVDRLLESLLALARAQQGTTDGAPISIDDLVSAAIERRLTAISEMDLAIEFQDFSDAPVTGSETLLSRMVENVVDNAVRHNERGGWIRASTQAEGASVRLIVENGGPVIAQEAVSELPQPFRRHGADRTGSDTGTGLGLSIVAAVVQAHGGTLELNALGGGGLQVIIDLPTVASVPVGAST